MVRGTATPGSTPGAVGLHRGTPDGRPIIRRRPARHPAAARHRTGPAPILPGPAPPRCPGCWAGCSRPPSPWSSRCPWSASWRSASSRLLAPSARWRRWVLGEPDGPADAAVGAPWRHRGGGGNDRMMACCGRVLPGRQDPQAARRTSVPLSNANADTGRGVTTYDGYQPAQGTVQSCLCPRSCNGCWLFGHGAVCRRRQHRLFYCVP